MTDDAPNDVWQVFDVAKIKASMSSKPVQYKEFLRVPHLSCGIYYLQAGSRDMQTPHDEDEMYYVVEGRARLQVNDEIQEVKPGTVLYVRASASHSFFEIEEDMTLLVFFASGRPD